MKIEVNIINAFSVGNTGGNPAGVVFNADQLSSTQKQKIANLVGLPETAFVSQSTKADFKLDFFTPVKQIAHCGHATIATFSYLKAVGKISGERSSKETIDGTRSIVFIAGKAYMEQNSPKILPIGEATNAVLESLNINPSALKSGFQPMIVHTGNAFMIVPIKDVEVLQGIHYNKEKVSKIADEHGLVGFYLYADLPSDVDVVATTRMFAPSYGIAEEAATGMAAGPLAAYLYVFQKDSSEKMSIEQGRLMTPPSRSLINVHLSVENGKIFRLYAGGDAYISGKLQVEI